MPARKPKFDWSLLDRYSLYEYFQQLKSKIVGQDLTIHQFHKLFKNHIIKELPVRVSKRYDSKVNNGFAYVGGTYYSDFDQLKQKCIEINFVYNVLDKNINYTKIKFDRICTVITDVVLHEIIHMRQYRRRKFKDLPDYNSTAEKTEQRAEQAYYGCSDEIDAYSFNIACELLGKFDNDPQAVKEYLSTIQSKRSRASSSLRLYLKAFNWDYDHTIIKRLKSKTIRYIPNALNGKPYRNRDWINH